LFDPKHDYVSHINRDVMRLLQMRGKADKGDLVIITKGDVMGVDGGTSSMKIARMDDWIN
jgi:pyruvate kinase